MDFIFQFRFCYLALSFIQPGVRKIAIFYGATCLRDINGPPSDATQGQPSCDAGRMCDPVVVLRYIMV